MSKQFDVAVIGGGPAGYVAAIRAGQLGYSVACIEQWKTPKGAPSLGGTCLNVGCIPSKALLESSENYEKVTEKFADHGITVGKVEFDVARMIARKESIVSKNTKGIEFLFRKNKVTWLKGHGKLAGKADGGYKVDVSGDAAGSTAESITVKHIIIATGSKARHLPNVPVDNKIICDNEGALSLTAVPKKLGVIGAGVIGLELGSVWRRLGADVTVLGVGITTAFTPPDPIPVPAGEIVVFDVSAIPGLPAGRHSMVFSTLAAPSVVIERVLTRPAGDSVATTVVMGMTAEYAVPRWYVPIAAGSALPGALLDNALVVYNVDGVDATVTVKAIGPGGELAIPSLTDIPIGAGGIATIDLTDPSALGLTLVVESTQRLYVERLLARGGDLHGRSGSWAVPDCGPCNFSSRPSL